MRTTTSESGVSHPHVSGAKYWEYSLQNKNDWRIWRVEQTSGGPGNGDAWDTWWEVTTGDGTLFVFGREKIFTPSGGSGVATTRARTTAWGVNTQSLQAVPIYFTHDNPATTGGVSCTVVSNPSRPGYCMAGLAWHLDQVIDTSGNMATYRYETEVNRVEPKFFGDDDAYDGVTVQYDRAVSLNWIDYGRTYGDSVAGWATTVPYGGGIYLVGCLGVGVGWMV